MATSIPSNPLQRAHALSLEASTVLRPPSVPIIILTQALKQYQEAIELYEKAQKDAESRGSDEANTLKMLVIQHKKLLKDVERRILNAQKDQSSSPARIVGVSDSRPIQRRLVSESAATQIATRPTDAMRGMNIPSNLGFTGIQPSGLANRLSPPRSIPPFALRPPTTITTPQAGVQLAEPSLSPLYSSSSTSSSTEESFIHFGSPPETLDPFSRFWGMLENMIEEVSGPVMFATAPVNRPPATSANKNTDIKSNKKEDKLHREKTITTKDKGKNKEENSEDSFYVVRKGKGKEKEIESTDDEEDQKGRPNTGTGGPTKTAEELLLENESLKISLDGLAIHAESLDTSNKLLKKQLEEREKGLKVIMESLKKEAGRVKAGQEIWKSQLLANSLAHSTTNTISNRQGPSDDSISKKRIKELEDELRSMKAENEKQKETITRYKERFEKIKLNAKAKKEAKLAAAVQSDGNGEK
ncbi:uncharacterized protein L201_000488 [Kwoniella dendrophila CBS 6074]|uniref:MIT domain-containing protein n=1 Tax=Kwoniella dendrophila CBS 6074 TaxID=1295534 RepID=A0AAX4JL52_9TREE